MITCLGRRAAEEKERRERRREVEEAERQRREIEVLQQDRKRQAEQKRLMTMKEAETQYQEYQDLVCTFFSQNFSWFVKLSACKRKMVCKNHSFFAI